MRNSITYNELQESNLNSNAEVLENIKDFVIQRQLYNSAIKEIRTKLEILDEEFSVKYSHNPIHHMEYRLKTPQSIIDKLKKKGMELSIASIWHNLTDVAGVRVICNYLEDINKIAELLLRQDDVTLIRRRDYIKHPKANGYRSLHIVVSVPIFLAEETVNVPVEIQVRTIAMDFWASLEHQLKYKSDEAVSEELRDRLLKCADSIARLDIEMQSIYKAITNRE